MHEDNQDPVRALARELPATIKSSEEYGALSPAILNLDDLVIQEIEGDRFNILHDLAPDAYTHLKNIRAQRSDIKIVVIGSEGRRVGLMRKSDDGFDIGYLVVLDEIRIPEDSTGDYCEIGFSEMYLINGDGRALSINSLLPPDSHVKKAMAVSLNSGSGYPSGFNPSGGENVLNIGEVRTKREQDTVFHEVGHIWQARLNLFNDDLQDNLESGLQKAAEDDWSQIAEIPSRNVALGARKISTTERVGDILSRQLQQKVIKAGFQTGIEREHQGIEEYELQKYDSLFAKKIIEYCDKTGIDPRRYFGSRLNRTSAGIRELRNSLNITERLQQTLGECIRAKALTLERAVSENGDILVLFTDKEGKKVRVSLSEEGGYLYCDEQKLTWESWSGQIRYKDANLHTTITPGIKNENVINAEQELEKQLERLLTILESAESNTNPIEVPTETVSVFQQLNVMYGSAYSDLIEKYGYFEPILEIKTGLHLKGTGGAFHRPKRSGDLPTIEVVPSSRENHYRSLTKERQYSVRVAADLLGIDVKEFTRHPDLLAMFVFLHELGHAHEYIYEYYLKSKKGKFKPEDKSAEVRKQEMDSLPVRGVNPNTIWQQYWSGALKQIYESSCWIYQSQGIMNPMQLAKAQEKKYRTLPTEKYADEFAAREIFFAWNRTN